MQDIAEKMADKKVNDKIKEKILSGQIVDRTELDALKQLYVEEFKKGGNKRFIKILKDEMKNLPIKVKINISEKQKRMGIYVEKLTNVFRQIIANPMVLQDKNIANLFNKILEASNLEPMDFTSSQQPQQITQPNQINQPAPVLASVQ